MQSGTRRKGEHDMTRERIERMMVNNPLEESDELNIREYKAIYDMAVDFTEPSGVIFNSISFAYHFGFIRGMAKRQLRKRRLLK